MLCIQHIRVLGADVLTVTHNIGGVGQQIHSYLLIARRNQC